MTNRGLLLVISVVAMLVAVGVCLSRHQSPTNQINKESLYLIKKGDTQTDVEKILGVPAGDYSGGATLLVSNSAFKMNRLISKKSSDEL